MTLRKQPFRLAFEAGGVAARPAGTPNPGFVMGFVVSPIFSFLGDSGDKIKCAKTEVKQEVVNARLRWRSRVESRCSQPHEHHEIGDRS